MSNAFLGSGRIFRTTFCKLSKGGLGLGAGRRTSTILRGVASGIFRVASIAGGRRGHGPTRPFAASDVRRRTTGGLGFHAQGAVVITRRLCRKVTLNGRNSIKLVACVQASSAHISTNSVRRTRRCVANACNPRCTVRGRHRGGGSRSTRSTRRTVHPSDILEIPDRVRPFLAGSRFGLCRLV